MAAIKAKTVEAQVLAVGVDGHHQQADQARRVGSQRGRHLGGSARVGGGMPVVADLDVEGRTGAGAGDQQAACRSVGHRRQRHRGALLAHDDLPIADTARKTRDEMYRLVGRGAIRAHLTAGRCRPGADCARDVESRTALVVERAHGVGKVVGVGRGSGKRQIRDAAVDALEVAEAGEQFGHLLIVAIGAERPLAGRPHERRSAGPHALD